MKDILIKFELTQNDPDRQEDDERSPPAQVGPTSVRDGSQDRGAKEAHQRRQAPDEGHVLVKDT